MIEYRIDTLFNGNLISYQVIKERVGKWPFTKWVVCHEERLYCGKSPQEAQKAIDDRVAYERGHEVKHSQRKNDRGETPIEDYMW